MNYSENKWVGNEYRDEYVRGIHKFIKSRKEASDKEREVFAEGILDNVEEYRGKYAEMLGYPLNVPFDENDIPDVKKIFVAEDNGIKIYRMQIEVVEDLWFYGLLFVKEDGVKRPFAIGQHGGAGTAELCSSIFDSANYNDMVQRVLKYDVNVFAPQLLLWDKLNFGTNYDRERIDSVLKQTGSSITALEIHAIRRSINYFANEEYTDRDKIGMFGLSYGGHYTLYTTAIETRIKAALSCSFFNNRFSEVGENYYHGRSDWTWFGSGNTFLDGEIALLAYPRYLKVISGDKDEAFNAEEFKEVLGKTKELIKKKGKDTGWFDGEVFDGYHEFSKDERHIEEFIAKLKG